MSADIERLIAMIIFGGLSVLCLVGWYSVLRSSPRRFDLWGVVAGIVLTAVLIMAFLSTLGVGTLIRPW